MPDQPSETADVRCLLCHAHVPMALDCLGSLRRAASEPFELTIHDDGSLTPQDGDLLMERLAPKRIISRAEADERMAGLLGARPHARAYRTKQAYALKLFDLPLLGSGSTFTIIDSDILFMRQCRGLFTWPGPARFMVDDINAYSPRPWQIYGLPLPARLNVGWAQLRREAYDADYLEWFVGEERYHRIPIWIEQTAWAAQAQRTGCTVVDRRQMRLMNPAIREDDDVAVLHFVTPQRSRLASFVAASAKTLALPAVDLRSHDPGPCRPLAMTWERLRGKLFPVT